jgi:hypothetical protein
VSELESTEETQDPRHPKYLLDVVGDNGDVVAKIDIYDVVAMIKKKTGVDMPHCVFHAFKKMALGGFRGHKDQDQDIKEAIVSLQCFLRQKERGLL